MKNFFLTKENRRISTKILRDKKSLRDPGATRRVLAHADPRFAVPAW
jgi:hypothetical protein